MLLPALERAIYVSDTYRQQRVRKKLTITVDEEVYAGLHRVVGRRHVSRFLTELARPHVVQDDLEATARRRRTKSTSARPWNGSRASSPTLPMNPAEPRRGQIWWVAFDRPAGGEIRKTRPAVVVGNDAANRTLNRVQVVPLTSKVTQVYPAQALVTLERQQSKG